MSADCLKLTTYFGERDRTEHGLLADALLDLYGSSGIASSVLLRGIGGFGHRHRPHSDRLLSLSEDLPVASVAVDRRERIEALLPAVLAIKRTGLLTLERARILSGPETVADRPADEAKLTVYVGRQDRIGRIPAFVAICALLHRHGLSGATALLGVDGTGDGERRRARFLSRNAEVPMMIIGVGSAERITTAAAELLAQPRRPLVTLERVQVCKRDGELLGVPHPLPATDEHGLTIWQKLMVHGSESAQHGGQALHRALVRRLRVETAAAGATSLRGIWGFHGDHPPHGDRLLQLRRHVPVVTIVIDTPERIARAFDLVDEVTRESGLVTSEIVPAMTASGSEDRRGRLRLARYDV